MSKSLTKISFNIKNQIKQAEYQQNIFHHSSHIFYFNQIIFILMILLLLKVIIRIHIILCTFILSYSAIIYQIMPKSITIDDSKSLRFYYTVLAGAVASFITQPLEVIKTNRINSPSIFYHDLHKSIVSNGWTTYMRGGSLAVVRQAYGFTIYTQLLTSFENKLKKQYPTVNKFFNYSMSSVTAKLIAMTFEAPITLLKTRVQCVNSQSVLTQFKKLKRSSIKQLTKGLGSSIARQGLYTLFHYNSYRYLKDDLFLKQLEVKATFIPAFIAGVVALTVSQPFEFLRSKISLMKFNEPVFVYAMKHWKQSGIRGFFIGFLPRLLRKPINSGICWSIVEWCRHLQ